MKEPYEVTIVAGTPRMEMSSSAAPRVRSPGGPDTSWRASRASSEALDLQKGDVEVLQALGRLEAAELERLQEREDVADARQVHAVLPGERLDRLQLHEVPLRVPAPVGHRALRLDHVEVLVHHQRPRMGLEDLGRDAERVDRLVEVDAGPVAGRGRLHLCADRLTLLR